MSPATAAGDEMYEQNIAAQVGVPAPASSLLALLAVIVVGMQSAPALTLQGYFLRNSLAPIMACLLTSVGLAAILERRPLLWNGAQGGVIRRLNGE